MGSPVDDALDRLSRIETQVRFVYDRSPDGNGLVLPNRDVLALVEIAKAAQVAATLDVAEQTATSETWFEPRGVKQKLRAALARLDSGAAE